MCRGGRSRGVGLSPLALPVQLRATPRIKRNARQLLAGRAAKAGLSPESECTTRGRRKQLGSRIQGITLSHLQGAGLVLYLRRRRPGQVHARC
jgi:hypothetical protein